MDNEMIERCREALWNEHCPGIRRTDEDDKFYIKCVTTIIKAIREPTDKMIVEGELAVPELLCFGEKEKSPSYVMYQAMIDAVINEY